MITMNEKIEFMDQLVRPKKKNVRHIALLAHINAFGGEFKCWFLCAQQARGREEGS